MYICNMNQYVKLNNIYCKVFDHVNPPSRACVEVPLPKHYPVILEAIAWAAPIATGDVIVKR